MIAPMTSFPDGIGTPSHDSVKLAPWGKIAPIFMAASSVSSRSGLFDRMMIEVRPSPNWIGSDWKRSPFSIQYGKLITFVFASYVATNMSRACSANIARRRSPTSSMIASKSSCFASA